MELGYIMSLQEESVQCSLYLLGCRLVCLLSVMQDVCSLNQHFEKHWSKSVSGFYVQVQIPEGI